MAKLRPLVCRRVRGGGWQIQMIRTALVLDRHVATPATETDGRDDLMLCLVT
jgi:hypothetical protein